MKIWNFWQVYLPLNETLESSSVDVCCLIQFLRKLESVIFAVDEVFPPGDGDCGDQLTRNKHI